MMCTAICNQLTKRNNCCSDQPSAETILLRTALHYHEDWQGKTTRYTFAVSKQAKAEQLL